MLVMPKGPQRIVCLTEEPTEILYALNEGNRIVGISAYTVRPAEAKRDKPVVSAFLDGSVHKISALKPDLVIGFSDIQADLAKRLSASNMNVLIFNQRSIQEILAVVDQIGAIVHQSESATRLIESYCQGLEQIERVGNTLPYRPRVYFEEWDDPAITGIQWVSELVEIAGGIDVFADRARGKLAKERFVTTDEVIEKAPQVVFASWCGKSFDRGAFDARFGSDSLPAQQTSSVYEIPSEIILQPGPACLTDGVQCIHQSLTRATFF